MKQPANEAHDFIVENVEPHAADKNDVAVLLTDVRGGKVRLHMSSEQAKKLSAILSTASR